MKIADHAFAGNSDMQAMADLVREFPAGNLHLADLPYRFSSWAFDFPENIRLWRNENGQLLAWAVLQVPFWTIDYAYHPDLHQDLHARILKWADDQARAIVNTPSGHPAWFATVLAGQENRIHDLEQAGFASQADVGEDSWSQVLMEHSMQIPQEVSVPDGFQIRQLNGADEVDAYVDLHRAVFESKNMTPEWRNRILERPEYIAELDLVAVSPIGQLAAFCICWLAKDGNGHVSGQIEPLGVRADFRMIGLGRAILSEGLRRSCAKGAQKIYVQTDNYRNAAFKLYQSAGFFVTRDIQMYRRNYQPACGEEIQ